MSNPLPSLKAKLIERLPMINGVTVYEEPLSDVARRHAIPNDVRVRITLATTQLRLGVSGLIFAVNPQDTEGETAGEWVERLFPNRTPMVIPPYYYRDKEGEVKEWQGVAAREGENAVVAFSAFDGGLGSIVIDEEGVVRDTIKEGLEWHPPIQEIRRVVAEVLTSQVS